MLVVVRDRVGEITKCKALDLTRQRTYVCDEAAGSQAFSVPDPSLNSQEHESLAGATESWVSLTHCATTTNNAEMQLRQVGMHVAI